MQTDSVLDGGESAKGGGFRAVESAEGDPAGDPIAQSWGVILARATLLQIRRVYHHDRIVPQLLD